jgi:hypothetical protein
LGRKLVKDAYRNAILEKRIEQPTVVSESIQGANMATLPYVTAPRNIEKALNGIKSAATPERVSLDFVKTILKIPGGSGNQINSYLKKVGFVNSDGTPSNIYKRFRNSATSGSAVAEALRTGYAPLYTRNEFMHQLSDDELKGLIIEETGQSEDNSAVGLTLSAIKTLKKYAKWGDTTVESDNNQASQPSTPSIDLPLKAPLPESKTNLNLSYTITLNLPATSDIAVFNAIFKSLRDNLLRDLSNE